MTPREKKLKNIIIIVLNYTRDFFSSEFSQKHALMMSEKIAKHVEKKFAYFYSAVD